VDDVRGVLLQARSSDQRIPLSEVATVADTSREQRLWARLDGVPAVRVSIRKQPDANTVFVSREVSHRLEELAQSRFIPGDLQYEVLFNQAFFINAAVQSVRDAAPWGRAFDAVRCSWGACGRPSSPDDPLVSSRFVIWPGPPHAQHHEPGGLASGRDVGGQNDRDDREHLPTSAVRRHGYSRTRARRVTSAVVASTMTHLAAVVPFLLITGLAALIFRELVLTISFAIAASLFTALTLVPMLAAQLGKVRRSSGIERSAPVRAFGRGLERVTERYRRLLGGAVRRPRLVLAGSFAALAFVPLLVRGLGNEFLPTVDDGNVGVSMVLAPGTSPQRTNETAQQLEAVVRGMPYVRHILRRRAGASSAAARPSAPAAATSTCSSSPPPSGPTCRRRAGWR
jgi:multidrug efflux pump subunit AcrB